MREFNLIPTEYLLRRERVDVLRLAGMAFGVVLVLYLLTWVSYKYLLMQGETQLAELQEQQNISGQERAQLAQTAAERDVLLRQWQLLQSLRSGLSADRLVLSVEAALPANQVWFSDWKFRREGVITPTQPNPQAPEYLLQLGDSSDFAEWQMLTHMSVRGQAIDHAALSEFSRALLKLEHVHEVKLQRTSLATRTANREQWPNQERLVNFDLAIVIKTQAGDAS